MAANGLLSHKRKIMVRNKKNWIKTGCLVLLAGLCASARAQQSPPTDDTPRDPGLVLSVTKVQDLSFGAFSVNSSGGVVTVANNGSRSAWGGITLLNLGGVCHQAIFDVEATEGFLVTLRAIPDVVLTGSNGGTAILRLGPPNPQPPFFTSMISPLITVNLGGTLTVSSPAPAGTYNGSFDVIFDFQ